MEELDQNTSLFLVATSGPPLGSMQLRHDSAQPLGLTIGRHDNCDLKLPPTAETISRFHAGFRFDEPSLQWRVTDLASSWGTFLNGVRLPVHAELPLAEHDLLRLGPWTFAVKKELDQRSLLSTDDAGESVIHTITREHSTSQPLREDLLTLLLETASAIHKASTEEELAQQVLDAAVRGSGMLNAAVIRSIGSTGQIEIIAVHTPAGGEQSGRFSFSRSLLAAAAQGQVVELAPGGDQSQSIVQLNIAAAICVPLMLGSSPAAYLYLDERAVGAPTRPLSRSHIVAFCSALGTLAGLALSNLKRLDVERRQALVEHDLKAAAAAQKWVLPPREMRRGAFHITGESRPGKYVGGDFFDVVDLQDGRIAVALGDVAGKGVDASVLMTATQGFLHATLLHHRDPAAAAMALNRFVSPRKPVSRFVTLWMAVLDPAAATISYIDAGHGYAVLVSSDSQIIDLNKGGGPPLGVVEDHEYTMVVQPLLPGGRIVVVSDGVVEQPAPNGIDAVRDDFNMNGVRACLRSNKGDDVGELFECLIAHAGSTRLADDATAVCVRWS